MSSKKKRVTKKKPTTKPRPIISLPLMIQDGPESFMPIGTVNINVSRISEQQMKDALIVPVLMPSQFSPEVKAIGAFMVIDKPEEPKSALLA